MAKKKIAIIKYNYKDKGPNYEIDMSIDLGRFEKQFSRAQYGLDEMVMTSMINYMPMDTGVFIDVTKAMSSALAGSGRVVAAAPPFGRYLYEGKVMVDSQTGKGPANIPGVGYRFRKGAKLKATSRWMEYSKHAHPDVTDHWFDKAKEQHCDQWVKKAKELAGGGKRG